MVKSGTALLQGKWVRELRETLTTLFCRCRLYLAEVYQTQGKYPQEEHVAEVWLRECPCDETALRYLMLALHEQHLTTEALRRYRETAALAKKEGAALSSDMEAFAERLPHANGSGIDGTSTSQHSSNSYIKTLKYLLLTLLGRPAMLHNRRERKTTLLGHFHDAKAQQAFIAKGSEWLLSLLLLAEVVLLWKHLFSQILV